jgi:methionyl-tRNA formyltransferase
MTDPLRIVFAGTPDFAVPTLNALLEAGYGVSGVLTQPDRPAGRGRRLTPPPVKARAAEAGLPIAQPTTLRRDPEARAWITACAPEAVVVVAYGLILPRWLLDWPRLGCLNVHASLLPRWRGAAPIQRSLLAGDAETGVTLMHMDAGLDTGDVLHTARCPIGPAATAGELHDRLAVLGAEALVAALPGWAAGTRPAAPQPTAGVTYAPKIDTDESWIDWSCSAAAIDRAVRAFNPTPGARTRWGEQLVKLWAVEPQPDARAEAPPGTVLEAPGLCVATGAGVLRVARVQPAGGRPMAGEAFRAGHLHPGDRLG